MLRALERKGLRAGHLLSVRRVVNQPAVKPAIVESARGHNGRLADDSAKNEIISRPLCPYKGGSDRLFMSVRIY